MSRFFSSTTIEGTPEYLRAPILYERRPVTDLWNKLTDITLKQWRWRAVPNKVASEFRYCRQRLLTVYGPPGSGKSSAVWDWACRLCLNNSCPAIWINCSEDKHFISWKLTCVNDAVAVQKIDGNIDTDGSTVVVFDGVRKSTVDGLRHIFNPLVRKGVAVILVSSEGVRIHQGDANDIAFIRYRVPAWTLEEYMSACANNCFWSNVAECFALTEGVDVASRNQAAEDKFVFAGHCARFMFRCGVLEIQQKIDECSNSIPTITDLNEALRAHGHVGAVNTVISWLFHNGRTPLVQANLPVIAAVQAPTNKQEVTVLDNEFQSVPGDLRNCFVSVYAARTVLSAVQTSVSALRSLAATLRVPALDGYAFEIRFQRLLDHAVQSQSHRITVSGSENWLVPCVYRDTTLELAVSRNHQEVGRWIWAGQLTTAFDAVHIYAPRGIRFVQVTTGVCHTFKLYSVANLLRSLAQNDITFTHVDFVVLRPREDIRAFHLKPAEGRLSQGWLDFHGVAWNTADPRTSTRVVTIPWDD